VTDFTVSKLTGCIPDLYPSARKMSIDVVVHSNPDKLCAIKPGQLFWVG
jgi:hypothetical protein